MPTPPTKVQTPRYRECENRLREHGHESLRKFCLDHKTVGRSWRWIAAEITRLTSLAMTDTTVWTWFKEDPEFVALVGSA